jgi:hypothetical protein
MIDQQIKKVGKLPAKVLAKEILFFLLYGYFAVWLCFPVMSGMDLKASNPYLSPLDEIYLAQLSIAVWFGIILAFYILRLIIHLIIQKFS